MACNNCFFYLCDAIDPPISISPVGSGNRRKLYRCDGKLGDVFDYFILACSHTSCIHHSTAYSNLGRGRSSIDMWIFILAFPQVIQRNDLKNYGRASPLLRRFMDPSYVRSARYLWVTRTLGVIAILMGVFIPFGLLGFLGKFEVSP